MRESSGTLRQDEHDYVCSVNRVNDGVGVECAGFNVARRDPTCNSVSLQGLD
jgi:hypothetical protein